MPVNNLWSRVRRLLAPPPAGCKGEKDLSRFVPSEIARQINSLEHRIEPGQCPVCAVREATILFTDIEGFTAIGESLSPERLIATLHEYFSVISAPVERHGGAINQFQGDAILATYNVLVEDPNHAANAVRTALEIQRVLKGRTFGDGGSLKTRIGINSGVVVGGVVGAGDRLGYTVHGDEVNLAARLEQLNKDYGTGVIVSESTCELAGR
jgi:adenylate cyclase